MAISDPINKFGFDGVMREHCLTGDDSFRLSHVGEKETGGKSNRPSD